MTDTLKIALTTQEGRSAKRPHQTYLSLFEPSSGLETSFPLSVKDSGKAKVELVCLAPQQEPSADQHPRLRKTFLFRYSWLRVHFQPSSSLLRSAARSHTRVKLSIFLSRQIPILLAQCWRNLYDMANCQRYITFSNPIPRVRPSSPPYSSQPLLL